MKLWTDDGKTYRLLTETPMDIQFTDALNQDGQALRCVELTRFKPDGAKHWEFDGCILQIDPSAPQSQRAEAGREALRTLGQLFRLGLGEAAQQGHVGTAPTDPHTQEQLAALLVEVKTVVESLRSVVLHQEVMVQKGQGTHGQSPVVDAAIVGASGTAVQGGAT